MLKKSASIVLASLIGSRLRRGFSEVGSIVGDFPFAKIHVDDRTAYMKCGLSLLAASLAEALLDGLFEHPEAMLIRAPLCKIPTVYCV